MPKIRKDGSIMTKPCVPCPDLPESEVAKLVADWLELHGCRMKRLNNGAGHLNGSKDYCTYGIIGGADYTGMLPNGRRLDVEIKKGKGGLWSKDQQAYAEWAKQGNGIYLVVHGVPELIAKIKNYLDNDTPSW